MKKGVAKLLGIVGMLAVLAMSIGCDNGTAILGGSITGKVLLDEKTTGNTGFVVSVAGTSYNAVTGDDGAFTISGVPAGDNYSIVVVYKDYAATVKTAVKVVDLEKTDVGTVIVKSEDITSTTDEPEKIENAFTWLGAFDNEEEIEAPKVNDAYFNSKDGCSYIYTGEKWELLAKAGEDGTDAEGVTKRITAKATDRGIYFTGAILSNIDMESSVCTIGVTEKESGIYMARDWTQSYNDWNMWHMTYPFVNPGKEYTFKVTVSWRNYTIYSDEIVITATGGLGEYKIENQATRKMEFTEDKVIKFNEAPKFTDNKNVNVIDTGIVYSVYRVFDKNDFWSGDWMYDSVIWDQDLSKVMIDLHDIKYWSGWRNYEDLDLYLSGQCCGVRTLTRIKVAGYSDADSTIFEMGDNLYAFRDWGGKKNKIFIAFVPTGATSDFFDDGNYYEYKRTSSAGTETYESKVTNMPGQKYKVSIEGEEGELYGMIVDYGTTIAEPTEKPEFSYTVKTADQTIDALKAEGGSIEFDGWMIGQNGTRCSFPYAATSNNDDEKVIIDGEEYYCTVLYANFTQKLSVLVNFMMNDGTDKLFGTKYYNYYHGYNYGLSFDEFPIPEREGYTFIEWSQTKDGSRWDYYANPELPNPLTLYAIWSKNYTVKVMANGTVCGTLQACKDVVTKDTVTVPEGYLLEGLYKDEAMTENWDRKASADMTVYAKLLPATLLAENNSSDIYIYQNNVEFEVAAGDVICIEVLLDTNSSSEDYVTVYDANNNHNFSTGYTSYSAYETKVIKFVIPENNSFISYVNKYGLRLRTSWNRLIIKKVYLAKSN